MSEDDHNAKGARHTWAITVNNPSGPDPPGSFRDLCKYLIIGEELAPTTGTPHLQCYASLHRRLRKSGLLKVLRGTSWERAAVFDTVKPATYWKEYCSKDGKFVEYGICPDSGKAEQDRWNEALRLAKEGRIDEISAQFQIQYRNTLYAIWRDAATDTTILDETCGLWIHGAAGTGKTSLVYALCAQLKQPGVYMKRRDNKWWDGFVRGLLVCVDDLSPRDLTKFPELLSHLKDWGGQFPFQAEWKGSQHQIRPKYFIVTSQYSLRQCANDSETFAALSRRFYQLDMDKSSVDLTPGPSSKLHWVTTLPMEFWQTQMAWRNSKDTSSTSEKAALPMIMDTVMSVSGSIAPTFVMPTISEASSTLPQSFTDMDLEALLSMAGCHQELMSEEELLSLYPPEMVL